MPFVVKAVGVADGPFWVTQPTLDGKRALSKRREDAAVFVRRLDAQIGMEQMIRAGELAPVVFHIVDA